MSDWHQEDVKAALRKRGVTLASIARAAGISKQAMTFALQGRFSARAEQLIATSLDMAPHQIWPSRYRKDGQRIRLRAQSATERARADAAL